MYVEIEYVASEPYIMGRWFIWLRKDSGYPISLTSRWTQKSAERAGRRLLARRIRSESKSTKYRLDAP